MARLWPFAMVLGLAVAHAGGKDDRSMAITDDAGARARHANALVVAGTITREVVRRIPSRRQLASRLAGFIAAKPELRKMTVDGCRIAGALPPDTLKLECRTFLGCSANCMASYDVVEISVASRWTLDVAEARTQPSNGGDCGDCW